MQWLNNGDENEIFVFGSNLAGRHGKGAALYARVNCGAVYGQGEGLQGRSYGIPTKDEKLRTLPLVRIAEGISRFKEFAKRNNHLKFKITPIGCGLAGYHQRDIRPFLLDIPDNCYLSEEWGPNYDEVRRFGK
jgi:hypothetical protein